MARIISIQTHFLTMTNGSFTLPEGFTSAVVTNDGDVDATFTNNLGQTYALKAGEVFEWKNYGNYYAPIIVNAAGTTVRIAYTN